VNNVDPASHASEGGQLSFYQKGIVSGPYKRAMTSVRTSHLLPWWLPVLFLTLAEHHFDLPQLSHNLLRRNDKPEMTALQVKRWLKTVGTQPLFIEPGSHLRHSSFHLGSTPISWELCPAETPSADLWLA
jgi:hypothetical protein